MSMWHQKYYRSPETIFQENLSKSFSSPVDTVQIPSKITTYVKLANYNPVLHRTTKYC